VRAASTRWVAVLNNDVSLAPDCIEKLLDAAQREDAAFALPRLLSSRNPAFLDGTYDLLSRGGCAIRAGHGESDTPAWHAPRGVHFAPFTAVLLNRKTFLSLDGLDERFESYLEDVDYSLRLAVAGHRGIYVPNACGVHEGSATFGSWSPRVVRLISRNQMLLVRLNYPPELLKAWRRPILTAQLLWGLSALRHGRFIPWLQGKRDALSIRDSSEPRAHAAGAVRRIVEESERELEELTRRNRFWRLYFQLAGQGG
jgi:GT2 family glycosyltransferase